MTRAMSVCIGVCLLGAAIAGHSETPKDHAHAAAAEKATGLKLETLLTAELEGTKNTDVIVSRVTLPPHTTLPKHWHPGEEFAYILEGTASLWLDGKVASTVEAGSVLKVPLKKVHTAITGDEGATLLVFRVHERGQPERVIVE